MITLSPQLIIRIESTLIQLLNLLEDQSDPVPQLIRSLDDWPTELSPLHDFNTVHKLEQLLMREDAGPDHAAYLVDIVKGYGTWPGGGVGRIQGILTVLDALPWQRAYALACTYAPSLFITPEQQQTINSINEMSHFDMCALWRSSPSGHPYFDSTLPFADVFKERLFVHFGGFTPEISKALP